MSQRKVETLWVAENRGHEMFGSDGLSPDMRIGIALQRIDVLLISAIRDAASANGRR